MFRGLRLKNVLLATTLLAGTIFLAGCNSAADRAQSHYDRGLALVEAGEPVKAGLEFRNALKLNESLSDALYQLGMVEEQQANFDTAARIYLSFAEREPTHVDVRVRLTYILLASGQLEAAMQFAEQATTISTDNAGALVAKAAVELRLNNRGEATRLAQSALKNDPQFVEAYMVLASERILASDLPGAMAFLNQASVEGDRNLGLHMLRLSVLEAMDDQPGVEALLEKLSELYPDNSALTLSLVKWYVAKGRNADAEAAIRQFASKHFDDDSIQTSLVAFLVTHKGSDAALEEARKIVETRATNGGDAFAMRIVIAQLQFEAGDRAEAMAFVRSIISDETDSANRNSARIQLARMAANQEDWGEAEELSNAVLEDDDKNVEALRMRASVRLARGDLDKAIDDLLAGVNEAPGDVQIHSLLGSAYERKGLVVVAGEQYAKAMDLDKRSPASGLPYAQFLLRYGRADQALNVLESVRASKPDDRQVLSLLAQLKLNKRDWVGAQQIAETLRRLDSKQKDATADRIMAAALGGQDKLDESISLLQTSLSTHADPPGMLADLVGSYIKAGRLPDAETLLKRTLASNPSNVEGHILLGSVYSLSDRQDLARKAFIDADAADKNGVLGAAALAQFYLSTGDADAAENTATTALKSGGNNPVLRSILGTIYQQQEKFEDAIVQYELLFKTNPESTSAANDLASLLSERRGGPEALERSFEIAQRFQNSQVPQFLDTLGWIYYLRGEYPAALPLLKSAAEGLPQVALVQFHLGMAMKELGQRGPAIAKLNEAISLSPPLIGSDHDRAKDALQELMQDATPPVAAVDDAGKSQ